MAMANCVGIMNFCYNAVHVRTRGSSRRGIGGFAMSGVGAARQGIAASYGEAAGRSMSLRFRLVMIPALVLGLGVAVAIGATMHGARARVQAEVGSSMRLGRTLVEEALPDIEKATDPRAALASLAAALPRTRHVTLTVWRSGDTAPIGTAAALPGEGREAPAWFSRIVNPRTAVDTVDVTVKGRKYGEILIAPHPDDEVAEVWDEFKLFTSLFAGLALATVALIYWSLGLALRPIHVLADGMDQLEHGHFDAHAAPTSVTELRRIGERFNSLARALERLAADNRRLMERLIAVQETERKELARELHDDLGPRLFGIKADAVCILRAAGGEEIAARARSIGELVDGIQQLNRRFLARLRPLILDEMGLSEALRQLVDSWQERNPEIACTLALSGPAEVADEAVGLTAYRVVQECLTNVARHAGAGTVTVRVACDADGKDAAQPGMLRISVEDDGKGLPPDHRFGFGLLGMSERVRSLGGSLDLARAPGGGTIVSVAIPLARQG